MKALIVVFLTMLAGALLLVTLCSADELFIPFSCWPIELQQEFGKVGIKLDLSANERTKESWRYVDSRGSSYAIFTYRSANEQDFEIIKKITFEIEMRD